MLQCVQGTHLQKRVPLPVEVGEDPVLILEAAKVRPLWSLSSLLCLCCKGSKKAANSVTRVSKAAN